MLWLRRKFLLRPKADGRAFKSTQRSVAPATGRNLVLTAVVDYAVVCLTHPKADCRKIDTTGNSHIAAMRKLPVVLLCRSFPLLLKIRNRCHMRDSPP